MLPAHMPNNCPIREVTADGVSVGRCYFHLPDGKTCERHGDVSWEVEHHKKTGLLTREDKRGSTFIEYAEPQMKDPNVE